MNDNRKLPVKQSDPVLKNKFPGYPAYPLNEDFYTTNKEEEESNPQDESESGIEKSDNEIDS